MDLVNVVATLKAFGFIMPIPAALIIWNRLAKSGRWPTSKKAREDTAFWDVWFDEAKKEAGAADAGQMDNS